MTVGKPIVSQVSDSFNRPSDTNNYSTGDLVANSTTAGSVTPLQFDVSVGNGRGFRVIGAKLQKSGVSLTGAVFKLHLYGTSPVCANGDNGALSTDTANYIGAITFPLMTAYTDDALAVVHVGDQTGGINPVSGYLRSTDAIYGLLENVTTAYTDEASAETFTATLTLEQY